MEITKNEYGDSIYHCKDGRLRVYVRDTGKTISYPKYLLGKTLGRELGPDEFVHHKDKNPLNNDLSNLEIMSPREHASKHMRRFYDTVAICGWCGREFVWTGRQQENFYSNRRNHGHNSELPFCSRECSGRYGQRIQVENDETCRNPRRKLTDEQVRFIRENHIPYDKDFGSSALARLFNVDKSVVNYIVKGITYKETL